MSWTPLFSDITDSSLWDEPPHIRVAWITILAKKDYRNHTIETNAYLLSRMARITEVEAEEALTAFLSPDRRSRNQENEGRRMKLLEGNRYLVLSGDRYLRKVMEARKRMADADRQADKRARDREAVPEDQPEPTTVQKPRFTKPTLEEVSLQCAKIGLPEAEAVKFMGHYESNGWRVGKNPMKSWVSALTVTWKKNWESGQFAARSNGKPSFARIQELEATISTHPANREWIGFNLDAVTPELREDLLSKRRDLADLRKGNP